MDGSFYIDDLDSDPDMTCVLGKLLLVTGGNRRPYTLNEVEVIDLDSGRQSQCSVRYLPDGREEHGMATLDDAPVFCAGWSEKDCWRIP